MKTSRNGATPVITAESAVDNATKFKVSITNERGERYSCHANAVSLRMKSGVVQVVEQRRGCFVWFKRCNLEIRDHRRKVLFRLLAGSGHNDGGDLTIIAEVAHPPRDPPPTGVPVHNHADAPRGGRKRPRTGGR
jgi:hypothetical protein